MKIKQMREPTFPFRLRFSKKREITKPTEKGISATKYRKKKKRKRGMFWLRYIEAYLQNQSGVGMPRNGGRGDQRLWGCWRNEEDEDIFFARNEWEKNKINKIKKKMWNWKHTLHLPAFCSSISFLLLLVRLNYVFNLFSNMYYNIVHFSLSISFP